MKPLFRWLKVKASEHSLMRFFCSAILERERAKIMRQLLEAMAVALARLAAMSEK